MLKESGVLNKARGLFIGASLASILGCGPLTTQDDYDGGRKYVNDAGQSCVVVDDFADGNLISEAMNAAWTPLPGSTIVSSTNLLKIEGQRPGPTGYLGTMLKIQGDPYDTTQLDTVFFEARIGLVADPSAAVTVQFKVEVDGNSQTGGVVPAHDKTIVSQGFAAYHFAFGDGLLGPKMTSINTISISFLPQDDAPYFMEIKNVTLCNTGWNLFQ